MQCSRWAEGGDHCSNLAQVGEAHCSAVSLCRGVELGAVHQASTSLPEEFVEACVSGNHYCHFPRQALWIQWLLLKQPGALRVHLPWYLGLLWGFPWVSQSHTSCPFPSPLHTVACTKPSTLGFCSLYRALLRTSLLKVRSQDQGIVALRLAEFLSWRPVNNRDGGWGNEFRCIYSCKRKISRASRTWLDFTEGWA